MCRISMPLFSSLHTRDRTNPSPYSLHVLLPWCSCEAFANVCAITVTVSVDTLQEFALGSPPHQAHDAQPARFPQSNIYELPPMSVDLGTQRNGPQHRFGQQSSINDWWIGVAVWPLDKHAHVPPTSMRLKLRTGLSRMMLTDSQECLTLTAEMLSGLIKMHVQMLGMLSHHQKVCQSSG